MSSSAEARALELTQANRLAEAEAAWRALLEGDPQNARAEHFLGCVLARSGRIEEGLARIGRSIEREPRNAAFLGNRAVVLADAGRLDEAIGDLRRALRQDPSFAAAHFHLGVLLSRTGRAGEAVVALRKAAALEPRHVGAHSALGRALFESGDFGGARASFEYGLTLRPGDPDLLNSVGLALNALGMSAAAIARFDEALAARPGFAEAMCNRGHALRDSGDLRGAAATYERAFAARASFVEAALARAGAALDLGETEPAAAWYARALAIAPGSPDARYGLGQVALREHRFAEGWDGYEARFATRPPQASAEDAGLPRLTAESLPAAGRIAVCAEQGLGDQVLFCTLLPELAALGKEAVVQVDPRLAPVLARSMPRFAIVGDGGEALRRCDAQIPLGSLPSLFRRDAASFSRQPRALVAADPERVARYRAMLGGVRHVGISWRSLQAGERRTLAARKSAPLEALAVIARIPGVRLLDLQYGDLAAERAAFESRHPGALVRLPGLDLHDDLEGVFAAIEACDAVVTTSNVTAHFAGAIGKETLLVYLGGNAPFHYWVPGPDGRSLWYPSVRIVSARELETWERAFARAGAMLAAR